MKREWRRDRLADNCVMLIGFRSEVFYPAVNLEIFLYSFFFLSVHHDAFPSPPTLPVISSKLNLLPHLHLLTLSSPKILVERTIRLMTLFF